MACFEMRRVAVRVRMRIKLVHVVNNKSAVAGSLGPSIDLVVATVSVRVMRNASGSRPFCQVATTIRNDPPALGIE
jgi:hypothetical protein